MRTKIKKLGFELHESISGVCNDGDCKIFNERGVAEVVDIEEESPSTDGMVAMVIKPKHYNTPYQIISGDGKTEEYFTDGINPEVKIKLIKADELTADVMVNFGFPAWFAADYYIDTDFR